MKVSVADTAGELVWSRGPGPQGTATRQPAVLSGIIAALRAALAEAEGQLGGSLEVVDAVADVGLAAPEVYDNVPMTRMGDTDPHWKHLVETTIMVESASASITAEIVVVHKKDVALMRRIDNDNVVRF